MESIFIVTFIDNDTKKSRTVGVPDANDKYEAEYAVNCLFNNPNITNVLEIECY